MRDSKKYPNDMVENLAESPGMCSDGPGSAPIKIPKRELFSLREREIKKKGKEIGSGWRKKKACYYTSSRGLGPTRARHGCHTRFYKENRMHLTCAPGSFYTHMIDKTSVIPLQ
jgi:hypothetical protein